ncbi:MAG: hypothetical protein IPO06_14500 [Leptospiraceae bacterium]|nr:hypothetical protein [Leptospiraceae bacterium]
MNDLKRVADRHTAIEHYQFLIYSIKYFKNKETDNEMLRYFSDIQGDTSWV